MADVSAVFDDPDGEPIMMDVDEIPAAGDQSPGGTVLPFADLPTDVFDRIAAGMFADFTKALSDAVTKSTKPGQYNAAAYQAHYSESARTVDMTAVFDALRTLRRCASICSQARVSFRAYYVTAVFRSIVNAATIDVSDDGVLQGVTFKNHVLSIAACAEEIHHVMTVVKHRAKIQVTGGSRGLLSIPFYHKFRVSHRINVPTFLSRKHAKDIFALKKAEFESLPECGYRQYYVMGNSGICKDRHVRDCAAAALDKLGSYKTLAQEACPLLQRNLPLERLQTIMSELDKLEPTARRSALYRAIQSNIKPLDMRKKFHLRDTHYVRNERTQYLDEDSSQKSVIVKAIDDLHRFIGGQAEKALVQQKRKAASLEKQQAKKKKLEERKAEKEAKKAAQGPIKPLTGYMTMSKDAGILQQLKKDHPSATAKELTKKRQEMWKSLGAAGRKPWDERAELDKARYETEKVAWDAKMLAAAEAAVGTPSSSAVQEDATVADTVTGVDQDGAAVEKDAVIAETATGVKPSDSNEEVDDLVSQITEPLKALILFVTRGHRINYLKRCDGSESATGKMTCELAVSEFIRCCPAIAPIRKFIESGESQKEATETLKAISTRQVAMMTYIQEQNDQNIDVRLLPFVYEWVEFCVIPRRATKDRIVAAYAAINAFCQSEQDTVAKWHESARAKYIDTKTTRLNHLLQKLLKIKGTADDAALPHLKLPLTEGVLPDVIRESIPTRALEVCALVDSSPGITAQQINGILSFLNTSPPHQIVTNLIAFLASEGMNSANSEEAQRRVIGTETLDLGYIVKAQGSSQSELAVLDRLISREAQLMESVASQADAERIRVQIQPIVADTFLEALRSYASLSPICRRFVVSNTVTETDPVAAAAQLAAAEIFASELWPPECQQLWHSYDCQKRHRLRSAGAILTKSTDMNIDFVNLSQHAGTMDSLFSVERKSMVDRGVEVKAVEGMMYELWAALPKDDHTWAEPWIAQLQDLAHANFVTVSEETKLKFKQFSEDETRRLFVAHSQNDDTKWYDHRIAKAAAQVQASSVLRVHFVDETVQHFFARLLRSSHVMITEEMDKLKRSVSKAVYGHANPYTRTDVNYFLEPLVNTIQEWKGQSSLVTVTVTAGADTDAPLAMLLKYQIAFDCEQLLTNQNTTAVMDAIKSVERVLATWADDEQNDAHRAFLIKKKQFLQAVYTKVPCVARHVLRCISICTHFTSQPDLTTLSPASALLVRSPSQQADPSLTEDPVTPTLRQMILDVMLSSDTQILAHINTTGGDNQGKKLCLQTVAGLQLFRTEKIQSGTHAWGGAIMVAVDAGTPRPADPHNTFKRWLHLLELSHRQTGSGYSHYASYASREYLDLRTVLRAIDPAKAVA